MQNKLEIKLGLKTLSSLDLLTKALRNRGPFGESVLESLSLMSIFKKAEDEADIQASSYLSLDHFPNICRVTKVWLEDKYENEHRILVEQIVGEVLQLPDSLNGFEYLFHPELEKEANLLAHFRSWHLTTLSSLYYILENSTLSLCFLNPQSPEEKEMANELRKRFNLVVTGQEFTLHEHPDCTRLDPSLQQLCKSRHSINRLLFKIKLASLSSFTPIYEEVRGKIMSLSPVLAHPSRSRRSSESPTLDNSFPPSRFPMPPLLIRMSSVSDYSVDSIAGNTVGYKPFRLQESVIQEQTRKLSSGFHDRTDTELSERMHLFQAPSPDISSELFDRLSGELHISGERGSDGKLKSCTEGKVVGLAHIGNQLLKSGSLGSDQLSLDEDEKIMGLCAVVDIAKSRIKHLEKKCLDRQQPQQGGIFLPTRVILNLGEPRNKHVGDYSKLGDWLEDQTDS